MIDLLRDGPVPIFLARAASSNRPPEWVERWYFEKVGEWYRSGVTTKGVVCRGVELAKLQHVLNHGVDVPTGRPLWVDFAIEKAWEYGGPNKLIMILRGDALVPSHQILPFNAPSAEVEACKKEFQTVRKFDDRREYYFSRLDPSDPRVGSDYEAAYCRFPAGDPHECLVAMLAVLPPDADLGSVQEVLKATDM